MTETYRIRISDRLGPALCCAFAELRTEVVPRRTVIEGWLSADEFRDLLLRVEKVGVQLIRVDCTVGDQRLRSRQDPRPARTVTPDDPGNR
jgi:hypothetical protein